MLHSCVYADTIFWNPTIDEGMCRTHYRRISKCRICILAVECTEQCFTHVYADTTFWNPTIDPETLKNFTRPYWEIPFLRLMEFSCFSRAWHLKQEFKAIFHFRPTIVFDWKCPCKIGEYVYTCKYLLGPLILHWVGLHIGQISLPLLINSSNNSLISFEIFCRLFIWTIAGLPIQSL